MPQKPTIRGLLSQSSADTPSPPLRQPRQITQIRSPFPQFQEHNRLWDLSCLPPTPAFPPQPRPCLILRARPPFHSCSAVTFDHSGTDNKDLATPYSRRRWFLINVIIQLHAHNSHDLHHVLHVLFTRLCLTTRANLLRPIRLASPVARKMSPRSRRRRSPLSSHWSVSHPLLENGPAMGHLSYPLARGWTPPGSESESIARAHLLPVSRPHTTSLHIHMATFSSKSSVWVLAI